MNYTMIMHAQVSDVKHFTSGTEFDWFGTIELYLVWGDFTATITFNMDANCSFTRMSNLLGIFGIENISAMLGQKVDLIQDPFGKIAAIGSAKEKKFITVAPESGNYILSWESFGIRI